MLALITGGLHRVGAAIAAKLAEQGYDLALHAHRLGSPDPALAKVLADTGRRWAVFPADLSDASTVETLIGRVADYFGGAPDALVNSASIINEGAWRDVTQEDLSRHLAVNFVAPMLLTRSFAGALAEGQAGAVVNILDQRVRNPPIDQAAYTASKLALAAVTRVTARAFAPSVRINAVAPGMTLPGEDYSADQWDRLAQAMPLQKNSAPAEVADAVAYLLGARATTGQILYVDGGANLESYARDFVRLMRE
ncbi:SDR family oxidoreductase [Sphingomonas crusticola]|uniref:SDR family oxidoreductase n=1 Tax=Sphingomonas crusticola TaxID=1697973 RepID=UPI000E25E0E8|nr:SDR family oxidoreductase [Sphingomonas crusticola]